MIRRPEYPIAVLASIARVVVVVGALHLTQAFAGNSNFDKGLAAYTAGDMATAHQLWQPLAGRGDADAQFAIGLLYYDGMGVDVDHTESSYWFHLAAEQGHQDAQFNLGNAYLRGNGVQKSETMAVHWWMKAAEQGMAAAKFNLAKAYQEGAGIGKDEQKAARMFKELPVEDHPLGIAVNARLDVVVQPEECGEWLDDQSPNAYTIQLISTKDPENAYDLARQNNLQGYVVCSYTQNENTLHALLFGVYQSVGSANEAAADLQPALISIRPWVRKISSIKQVVANTVLRDNSKPE
jgi:hypothetical protein